jgi:chemotaxis protein histidine kinase CheA
VVKNLAAITDVASTNSSADEQQASDTTNLDQELEQVRSLLSDLQAAVRQFRHHSIEHELARNSRWVRIGRTLGLGPNFTDGPEAS